MTVLTLLLPRRRRTYERSVRLFAIFSLSFYTSMVQCSTHAQVMTNSRFGLDDHFGEYKQSHDMFGLSGISFGPRLPR